ncbi:MAG: hypothetical protein ABIM58_02480 [candidate division WOR-3 bacterium]
MNENTELKEMKKNIGNERHIYASFSYIPFLNFIPLFDSEAGDFVHFHAKQGFLIFVIEFIGLLFFFALYLLVGSIPVVRYIFINFFFAFYILCVAVLIIIGIYGALTGKKLQIPFIGEFVNKLNL